MWLELGVWLTRSLPRYDSMLNTARPILCARMESAFPLPCCFSILAISFFPSVWRRNRTAASENAHFKWTFPIFAPPVPSVFPPDWC